MRHCLIYYREGLKADFYSLLKIHMKKIKQKQKGEIKMKKKDLKAETTSTITIDPKDGDVTEQIQKILEKQNNDIKPMNRAQRRAMAKQNKKREKQFQKYLIKHPEAMKIELDEEAVKKVEEEERLAKETEKIETIYVNGGTQVVELNNQDGVIDVPFTEIVEEDISIEE